MKSLTVVVPCFNEEENLQKGVLYHINDYLSGQKFPWEVIIVDDGSSDKSRENIEKFIKTHQGYVLIKNQHQGKAPSVIKGVLSSTKDAILFTDMDQATPIEELDKLLPFLDKGFDVVIGSRNTKREGAPLLRLIMANGFILLRTLILGLKGIKDTQCGFKLFSGRSAGEIFSRLKLYPAGQNKGNGPMVTAGFDVEVLYIAQKLGYKIKEIPVFWHYVETRRVNPVSESISGLLDMLLLKINDINGKYSGANPVK